MKKVIIILLTICLLFSVAGCSALTPTEKVFSLESYGLQLTADSTFQEKTGGAFDLQITNNKSYISIMAYQYIDLPEGVTPLDAYHIQTEDLLSRRAAVTLIEESETHCLYSAEKDGVKNYYAAYLMDFPEEETFAWVLVTATPSHFEHNREQLTNIIYSLTTVG